MEMLRSKLAPLPKSGNGVGLKGGGLKAVLSWIVMSPFARTFLSAFAGTLPLLPQISRPNRPKTLFFTTPGRKMSVRAGGVMKQVKK
jgi:hypothetical protein